MEQLEIPATEPVKEKKNRKIFSLILILSIVLNLILIIKIINPEINITGSAVLVSPEIDKDLANNVDSSKYILHYTGLRDQIIPELEKNNAKNKVGIFVQDINIGAWMGINERMGFTPASLLKIPIMMAILKKVDRGEIALSDKIIIKKEDIDASYQTKYEGKIGQECTIEELLASMISESDNTAKNALARQLFAYEVDDVFKHVGIPNPYLPENVDKTVSPRDYARFFKALYYSTFLSPKTSDLALKLTTNTQLENLIPEGVEVAHKFGVYDESFLHDCGIVYHKDNPYIICVMTKEMSSTISSEIIRKVSSYVYDFVDKG